MWNPRRNFLMAMMAFLVQVPAVWGSLEARLPTTLKWNAGPIALLQTSSVQRELKLGERQQQFIREWLAETNFRILQDAMQRQNELMELGQVESFGNVMHQLRMERATQAYQELDGILNLAQIHRLQEIDMQVAGLEAFMDRDIHPKFSIEDKQREHLRIIQQVYLSRLADLRHRYDVQSSNELQGKRKEDYERDVRKAHDAALIAFFRTFTEDQRRTYCEICGNALNVGKLRRELEAVIHGA